MDESEVANFIDDAVLRLSAFEPGCLPGLRGETYRKFIPAGSNQHVKLAETANAIADRFSDAADKATESIALIHCNMLCEGRAGGLGAAMVRELMGGKRANAIDHIRKTSPSWASPPRDTDRIAKVKYFEILDDGAAHAYSEGLLRHSRGKWFNASADLPLTITMWVDLAAIACVTRKNSWAVEIGHPSLASVLLFTDPTGVKEWFRLRDAPPGSHRRDALLHWVSAHWRKKREDPDMEVYVRQHMRGSTSFTWFDMKVDIQIPQSDTDRTESLKRNRLAMKILGADRRPANRLA